MPAFSDDPLPDDDGDSFDEHTFPCRTDEMMEAALGSLEFEEQDCFAFLAMLPARPESFSMEDLGAVCQLQSALDPAEFAKNLVRIGLLVPQDENFVLPPEVKAYAGRMLF